ncbi:MAG: protein-L-isoaspartate(D-aspartate) O-methyltransferase [Armatimonadetes bacterium]|jgi:protein-L-isoaspartate(D-aspartate) O-methyltransferase|nr:protein-L-isoaspartate(D-aspartate) O-methyltransferase [Armatimonadota bacterium]MDI9584662.1 protein-L-isoaspartate(D-aspartate) O-methyltransferase [Acidobacteriota bacterium]
MVATQLEARGITDRRVLDAMRTVPRHEFVPASIRDIAYTDQALAIGHGQTISQPYIVALMCQLLEVESHHRVFEVGAGSGYQAALLGQLAAEVYSVDLVPELVDAAARLVERLGYENVHIIAGDGTLGLPEKAPFDRIIVAAAAPDIPPPLIDQLAPGGRLIAPVGDRFLQRLVVLTRTAEGVQSRNSIGCVFVPLLGRHGWSSAD